MKTPNSYSIVHENVAVKNTNVICNLINRYFINLGRTLSNGIGHNNVDATSYIGDKCLNSFFFIRMEPNEITNIISK